MKKTFALLLALALCLQCLTALGEAARENAVSVPELTIAHRPIPENEAMAFLKKMGVGWNLGNTFDATKGDWNRNADEMTVETSWGNPKTTLALFDALQAAGFSTVRIPVSWHDHVDEAYNISEKWLSRVEEVVDWALSRDLYVILNIHHDEEQFLPTLAHESESTRYVSAVWTQLAARFRDRDDHLIFESLNEPRVLGASYEWWYDANNPGCVEAAQCINRLNQLFVDIVRASGGNNADRYLMVPGYDAAPGGALNNVFELPQDTADNKLIVSIHAYTPYDFALNVSGGKTFGTQAQKQEIVSFMNSLYNRYIVNGVPVVIGEYGALIKGGNLQDRVNWTAFYVATASARNIPCVWWDNGAFKGSGELFGLVDRRAASVYDPEIVEAIMTYGGWDKLPDAN
uniref:Putative glycosyl hydrolase family 5 n=1 Tax=uncultured bacterium Ad_091_F22_contig1 TaxID=1489283 RepID=A0A0B4N0P4_9BACT|nr:putative glycosyl hydrolase family 5 [uncultured bacterium Ad_091_F22_contig1]